MEPYFFTRFLGPHAIFADHDVASPDGRAGLVGLRAQPAQAHVHQVPLPLELQVQNPFLVADAIGERRQRLVVAVAEIDPGVAPQKHDVRREIPAHRRPIRGGGGGVGLRVENEVVVIVVEIVAVVVVVLTPPLAARALQDDDEEAILLAGDRPEVDFAGNRDPPAGLRRGEVDRELVRRDADLLAEERLEALEFHGGVDGDAADLGLALAVEEDNREGDTATTADFDHLR
ncbi:hypothetical protein TIFTF001_008784 [Ficus carica]|uniref:Uncharacterized protein n=1 Tax=Ficus carica TaxID=3494 RepID=A0AA88D354_FICCA|nr:hypothetical protein TIFTF001_008784 [Ficus carica]